MNEDELKILLANIREEVFVFGGCIMFFGKGYAIDKENFGCYKMLPVEILPLLRAELKGYKLETEVRGKVLQLTITNV